MQPFNYRRAHSEQDALRAYSPTHEAPTEAPSQYLAGGTTMLDLMKLDAMRPQLLIDIGDLTQYDYIRATPEGLHLGALTRMHRAASDSLIQREYPVIAQSLQLAASAQIRNMATLGGNVLQRTRCNYFRNTDWPACNKRAPGSGCSALDGVSRKHAVLGVSDQCISAYPGDFAQALVALEATVEIASPRGKHVLPFEQLHREAEDPHRETVLHAGELITGFIVPSGPWTRRSLYLKVRDRESYEFALASAAVALHLEGQQVLAARIALGGVAYRPWRSRTAEQALVGQALTEETASAAAQAAFAEAITHPGNEFKPEVGRRTQVRALLQASAMEVAT
jgi:xanthine dehydrogenase YagS FAD-binding subunit